jgi:hypothetical protein
VTITDPLHAARLPVVTSGPSAPPPDRTPWTPAERLLALLVLLLLLVAFGVARDLRTARSVRSIVAGLQLRASTATSVTTFAGGSSWVLLDLDLAADPRHDLRIRSVTADHGWDVVDSAPATLYAGATVGVTVRRALVCVAPLPRPQHLTLVLGFAGDRRRTVAVPVTSTGSRDLAQSDYLCGRLDAARSLELTSTSRTTHAGRSAMELHLADRGLSDLVVHDLRFPGFSFRASSPLPLALAGRAPGPLQEGLPSRPLQVQAAVSDCATAGRALEAAVHAGTPDQVQAVVSGQGGGGLAPLVVSGLTSYLDQQWRARCPLTAAP